MDKETNRVQKPWWVYIVKCSDGTYYTGIAPDINKRIEKHNSGNGAKYTRSREPVELLYYEEHENRSLATKREMQIKKLTRDQKKELISNFFPTKRSLK